VQGAASIGKDDELSPPTDPPAALSAQVAVGHQLGDDLKRTGLFQPRPGHDRLKPGAADARRLVGVVGDRHQRELLGGRQVRVGRALKEVDRHQRHVLCVSVACGVMLYISHLS
jgi:hypothetical protein